MNFFFIGIFPLCAVVLALPAGVREKSCCRFFIALVLSYFGVVLPLFFFFFSVFIAPEWKGACHCGWLDCFIVGKTALTPLALWATAALYALEVLRVKNRPAPWLVLGVFLGATVAVVCFVIGLICYGPDGLGDIVFLAVPGYVAVWYLWRAVQLIKAAHLGTIMYIRALIGSVPFWAASWLWSVATYKSLPDYDPSCFVVTAASRGHEAFVGPFTEIVHHGRKQRANQQLIIFWQVEALWGRRAPRSHRCFRRIYNRVGPVIARRMTSPWLADAVCAALKPLEWTANLIVKINTIPTHP
jgi:hypothetical protein